MHIPAYSCILRNIQVYYAIIHAYSDILRHIQKNPDGKKNKKPVQPWHIQYSGSLAFPEREAYSEP